MEAVVEGFLIDQAALPSQQQRSAHLTCPPSRLRGKSTQIRLVSKFSSLKPADRQHKTQPQSPLTRNLNTRFLFNLHQI